MRNPLLLDVDALTVSVETDGSKITIVRDVRLQIESEEAIGIVGESGSGKSSLAFALAGLSSSAQLRIDGKVLFRGEDMLRLGLDRVRKIRGAEVSLVFQDPHASLDPLHTIGSQLVQVLRAHRGDGRIDFKLEANSLLALVGLDPSVALAYPHQLSGGMKQRAVIAIAVANKPSLLIADEPTSALDVIVQKRIVELLTRLRQEMQMALVVVSHDLGVMARLVDRVLVMYGGRIVEDGPTATILTSPAHHYTRGLLDSLPSAAATYRVGDRARAIPGVPIRPEDNPAGCPFVSRCSAALEKCGREMPPVESSSEEHHFRCWNPVAASGTANPPGVAHG